MRLSVSNIAWYNEQADEAYSLMQKYGFSGLEIAPPSILGENPYDQKDKAISWANEINSKYNFTISSFQSIWYQRPENIFKSEEDRNNLLEYTKKAILLAESISCKNLVFGCPKNRNNDNNLSENTVYPLLSSIAEFAQSHNTVFAMEANPAIYNVNFINNTKQAFELVRTINNPGFKVNLDVGTMVSNNESIDSLSGNIDFINHVHISEPFLKPVEKRDIHKELASVLKEEKYNGFVSLEMAKTSETSLDILESCLYYVCEVFS